MVLFERRERPEPAFAWPERHHLHVGVGIRQGDQVQILNGLSTGDRVVTTGGLGLEDGTKVQIQKTEAASGEGTAGK